MPPSQVLDPTGAGDAYRAGLLKGLALGLDWPEAARMGAVLASFCVEQQGTQEHRLPSRSSGGATGISERRRRREEALASWGRGLRVATLPPPPHPHPQSLRGEKIRRAGP